MRRLWTYSLALFVLLSAVACGGEGEVAAPTVDTAAIVATVAAEMQTQEAGAPTPTTTLPPTATSTAVPTETPTATPTVLPVTVSDRSLVEELDLQPSLVDVYEWANPAVVYIIALPVGSGSGFVYNEEGMIVTNNHVVAGADSFEIVFANDERATAELVGTDVDSDLAVLQVEALPEGVEPLPLSDADSLQVGQFVVAIGNPFGEQGSMSLGIISALGRSLPSQRGLTANSTYSLPEVIQTDAPINPGNSGGPLLNMNGEVVGVNSAIVSLTGTSSGVGYSIPVAAVQQIVPSLIAEGSYDYPYVGARFDDEVTLEEQRQFGLPQTQGTYVVDVLPGSPAAEAGLVAADPQTGRGGDLIVAIDGRPVNDFGDLNSYLVFNTTVGQTVTLTVLRDGQEVELSLTLARRPAN